MGNRLKRWVVPSMAVLLAAVPAGCDSVNGLDLNKVLVEQAVKSVKAEPKQVVSASIGIKLNWNEELLDEELLEDGSGDEEEQAKEKQLIEWLSSITFKLNEMRTDEEGRVQADGVLTFGKGDIPFRLHGDKTGLLLEVEGAKRPLYVNLEQPLDGVLTGESPLFALQNTEAGESLVRSVASYLIGNLPNPQTIDAKSTSVDIHGTKTAVTQVHAELSGKELGELIPAYLEALAKDEEGLRKTLNELMQWFKDLPPELKESLGIEEDPLPSEEEFEDTVKEILDGIKDAQEEYQTDREEFPEDWNQTFSENTKLQADFYADSDLNIRKLTAELQVTVPAEEDELIFIPLESFTVRFEQENWLEEEATPIPDVVKPVRALDLDDLDKLSSVRGLRLFKEDSLIYDLLKNDLSVGDTSFSLLSEDEGWGWSSYYVTDKDGTVLVPLRRTMAGFEDPVVYREGALSFNDVATYQEVTLTLGSNKIKVNGSEKTWSKPVVEIDGVVYVSADDLLGLLGAEYSFPNGESDTLLIEREL